MKKKGEEDKILLIKQYRAPLDRSNIEFPAGLLEEVKKRINSFIYRISVGQNDHFFSFDLFSFKLIV
jgi:hypothetical protein